MQRRTSLFTLVAGFALLAAAPLAHAQVKEINFGLISTEASSGLKATWQPVLEDMSRVTGLKVNAFFATDYAGVIEAMRFNKVQVAWFGNKSAIEAVDRSNGEVFAKVVDKDGSEGYYSILVVHKDSPLKDLGDVLRARADLTLGFGDPNSTSGAVIPGYYAFAKNSVDPLKEFKRTVRANHETNLLAVASKQVDVATNNTENWSRFETSHPEKLKDLREIWRSPLIPSDPIVWRKDLDPEIRVKLRDFMLNYGKQPDELAKLNKLGYSQFRPSSDTQLLTIRQIELAKERSKAEQDTALTPEERTKKLQDIDSKLDALSRQVASAS